MKKLTVLLQIQSAPLRRHSDHYDVVVKATDLGQGMAKHDLVERACNHYHQLVEALKLDQFVLELEATNNARDVIRLLESRGDYNSGWQSTPEVIEAYRTKAALARQEAILAAEPDCSKLDANELDCLERGLPRNQQCQSCRDYAAAEKRANGQ